MVVFPVVPGSSLLALPLLDFFVVGVFVGALVLFYLLASFTLDGVPHFVLSELFKAHGRLIVARFENLLLKLVTHVNPLVDIKALSIDLHPLHT